MKTISIKMAICAIPAKIPVMNLLIFVDSRIFLYWIYQSKNMIKRNIQDMYIGIRKWKTYIKIPNNCPTNIPVHLLQIGNCHPFILKLLSSL